MSNIAANHAALAERHPVSDNRVYGYEVVLRLGDEILRTDLFAITTDGRAFYRKTKSRKEFNNVRAKWVECKVSDVPWHAAYIGTYLDDCKRQTA